MRDAGEGVVEQTVEELVADVFRRACTSREALEHVTGKWSLLALSALAESPHRFGELRRRIEGVSERMLAQSLQTLERDGWVHREVRSAIPPHVEYRLTEDGAALVPHLLALITFVEGRMPAVHASRAAVDEVRPPR
ncbi:winged helix-turn-helix transcriptional regulator [Modestobacter sp. VKM Ac-2984]|uniref:winged helix-turn-helix transcriptional regulator n=1 Tax=Modestobacter sp. VKM Ac-2984 TaxID=3004138 RepID=UPI0022AAB1F8|nr:helix-turn-helix domain-containing protein [Modestobacter sp. VKM Ac-2984]MCZ2818061.1 helix-turn-helix domain-containing protein [Modestobacter sp. VKM Ac-2984]